MKVDRLVEKFLESNPNASRAGGKCQTCRHKNREQIDRACRAYAAAKAGGRTMVTWRAFADGCLRREFGYDHTSDALLRHARRCLGLEA